MDAESTFISSFIAKPWDTHDDIDDTPGHLEPVSIRLYSSFTDHMFRRESVMVIAHGTDDQLIAVVDAIIADGWQPLMYLDPEDCQPAFGCRHLITFHAGHPGPTELAAALSPLVGLDGTDTLPWVKKLTPRRH